MGLECFVRDVTSTFSLATISMVYFFFLFFVTFHGEISHSYNMKRQILHCPGSLENHNITEEIAVLCEIRGSPAPQQPKDVQGSTWEQSKHRATAPKRHARLLALWIRHFVKGCSVLPCLYWTSLWLASPKSWWTHIKPSTALGSRAYISEPTALAHRVGQFSSTAWCFPPATWVWFPKSPWWERRWQPLLTL